MVGMYLQDLLGVVTVLFNAWHMHTRGNYSLCVCVC